MLPAIAVLHPVHAAVRPSGAVLATVAGTAAVVMGLAASVNVDLQPSALFVLGMWWWTIGKMWVETRAVRGDAGITTAALGAAAIGASFVSAFAVAVPFVRPDIPFVDVWRIAQLVLAAWLGGLAIHLFGMARNTMGR